MGKDKDLVAGPPMPRPSPADIAAAYFPGSHSENEAWVRAEFQAVLDGWFGWRKGLFADDPRVTTRADLRCGAVRRERELMSQRLGELCDALTAETPTYTPRYIGHMKAELSLPALFG